MKYQLPTTNHQPPTTASQLLLNLSKSLITMGNVPTTATAHQELLSLVFCNDNHVSAANEIISYIKDHPDAINHEYYHDSHHMEKECVYTPLMLACMFSHGKHHVYGQSHTSIIEALIKCGADVNYLPNITTPMYYMKDTNPNSCSYMNKTPALHLAVMHINTSSLDTVKLLIKNGADINAIARVRITDECVGHKRHVLSRSIVNNNNIETFTYLFDLYMNTRSAQTKRNICGNLLPIIYSKPLTVNRANIKNFLKSQIASNQK